MSNIFIFLDLTILHYIWEIIALPKVMKTYSYDYFLKLL